MSSRVALFERVRRRRRKKRRGKNRLPPRLFAVGTRHADTVASGDDDLVRHANEQTVIDNADGVLQLVRRSHRVRERRLEVQIHDVVAVIRHRDVIAVVLIVRRRPHAQDRFAPGQRRKLTDRSQRVHVAKRRDFHRQRETRSETLAKLGLVHDDDKLLRHDLNHLFSQQRTTAALHERQRRINLIRTIDRDVQFALFIQRAQRNVQRLGLLARALARRDANHILELPARQLLSDAFDRVVRRGSRTEADDHTARHVVVHRLVSDEFLQFVLAQRHGFRRRRSRLGEASRGRELGAVERFGDDGRSRGRGEALGEHRRADGARVTV